MSPAYGFDDEGEREHDCCDRCGRGSCPGSGSGGEDACTDHLRHPHPPVRGMVLGTRCNACDRPLIVPGCPLCVTCCKATP